MKTLLKVVVILVVVLVVGLIAAFLARNVIAATVIRSAATATLGVKVDVASVDLDLGGAVTINDLTVGNPPGYAQSHILTTGVLHVALSPAETTTSKIVVEEVRLDKVGVWYIGKGSSNNVSDLTKLMSGSGDGKSGGSGETVEIFIKKVTLTDIQAHYSMDDSPGTALPKVASIELKNVSTKGGADDISKQLSEKVFEIAMSATFDAVGKQLPGALSEGVGKSMEAAGVVIGEAGKAISGAAETTGKAVEDAAKGIGDLFGGNKK